MIQSVASEFAVHELKFNALPQVAQLSSIFEKCILKDRLKKYCLANIESIAGIVKKYISMN